MKCNLNIIFTTIFLLSTFNRENRDATNDTHRFLFRAGRNVTRRDYCQSRSLDAILTAQNEVRTEYNILCRLHLLTLTRALLPQLMPASSGNLTSFIMLMRMRSYRKNGIITRAAFAPTGYSCVPRSKSRRAVNFT